jgi:8-oxo-dGTP pyrophosphatase MutT (NUDIX family)
MHTPTPHLQALLEAYLPTDPREATHRERMLTLLRDTDAPFSRDQFSPGHFTASSFVLSPNGRQVLLIFHGKLHRWLQPGGHVDPGDESIHHAARREVAEETGIATLRPAWAGEGIFDVDVHRIPARRADPDHFHFDVRFLFQAPDLTCQAGSDATGAQWVDLSRVASLESDDSVMRAIQKLSLPPGVAGS